MDEDITLRKKIGNKGENLAAAYLTNLGYKIIEQNWRYKNHHEIDLIAASPNEDIVAVEVRTHNNIQTYKPFESIDQSKIARIRAALDLYARDQEPTPKLRVDVISIIIETMEIEHFEAVNLYL